MDTDPPQPLKVLEAYLSLTYLKRIYIIKLTFYDINEIKFHV